MPFQFNIEGPETRRARELQQSLQEEQLRRYQEDRMMREYEASRQVMPYENFKINVGGEMIDFRALSPEQKQAWKQQQEANWLMDQNVKMEKYKTEMAKAEVELEKLGLERAKISSEIAKGNVRPGPDFIPLTRPYSEKLSDIEQRMGEQRKKFERSGFGMQSMMDQTMPASYGVPPITTPRPAPQPSQQQAAPAQPQQVQPAAQAATQPQAQPEVKSYPDEASARGAGAKAGDIIILQNVKRSDGTIGPAKVRLKD
jgi:hypothetical protein